jgi:hypothetical protein
MKVDSKREGREKIMGCAFFVSEEEWSMEPGSRMEPASAANAMVRPVYLVGKCARPRLARAPHLADGELLRQLC